MQDLLVLQEIDGREWGQERRNGNVSLLMKMFRQPNQAACGGDGGESSALPRLRLLKPARFVSLLNYFQIKEKG
ncbi:hypothetical protein OIU76_005889 [Salix suchowensis]|nr:hypothetical protein OIU76_005889 [Salix suchowensis]